MQRILLFILLLVSQNLYAQSDSTSTGEIVDAEIIIEKDKKITLPQAEKIATEIRVRNFELEPLNFTYHVLEPDFDLPDYKSDISFAELNEKYPVSSNQNYISVGYGNYASPLLDVGVFKQINKMKISSQVFHESFGKGPIGGENSASSTSSIDLSANYRSQNIKITPSVSFERNGYRFYGNTDRINSGINSEVAQKVSNGNFEFNMNLDGRRKDLSYFIVPAIVSSNQSFVNGSDINKESVFEVEAGLGLKLDKKISAGLDLSGYSGNYRGGMEYTRSLLIIKPWVSQSTENSKVEAGFTLASGKTSESNSTSGFYPFVKGELKLIPKWSVYGSFDGGVEWNDLRSLLGENQFLDDSLTIQNSELTSSIGGGIKGSPIHSLLVKAGIKLDNYKGIPFYVPSSTDSSKFTLVYDDRTSNIVSIRAEATFSPSSTSIVGSSIEFYNYTVKSLEKAWHLPTYSFLIYFSKKIQEKVLLNTQLIAQGGITSPTSSGVGFTSLSSFADLNISVDYKVSERASVFVKLNNLLNKEYEKYIGYPVRGSYFKIGGSYRF